MIERPSRGSPKALSKPPASSSFANVHFRIPLEFSTAVGWKEGAALLDSGATHNFIDRKFVELHSLQTCLMEQPRELLLADGRPSAGSLITHQVLLPIRLDRHSEIVKLFVADVNRHPLVLGMPWLTTHNPQVHWPAHKITFNSTHCLNHCFLGNRPCSVFSLAARKDSRSETPKTNATNATNATIATNTRNKEKNSRKNSTDTPKLAATDACHIPKTHTTNETCKDTAPTHEQIQDSDLKLIPPEFHDFADVFSKKEAQKLPEHRPYDLRIELEEGKTPPFGTVYNLSPAELKVLKEYIDDNLAKGFIRHSRSPAGAPILFVKKKDGSLRLCVDYRGINNITVKNRYPLPLASELIDRIGNSKYFTTLDLRDGYHLLRMAPGEEWKTAFRCRYGLFEYTVMPFGLCNAPGAFQHFTNDAFRDYLDSFVEIYLDDILIHSETLEEHKEHVRLVLERLREKGLYAKPQKCQFMSPEVRFLGYLLSADGIGPEPERITAVTEWPTPTSAHDIRRFLGLANFYRKFIEKYSEIAAPMTALLRKDVPFVWDDVTQHSFDTLKKAFTSAPILKHFDRSRPTVLEADASDQALGGTISQHDDKGVL